MRTWITVLSISAGLALPAAAADEPPAPPSKPAPAAAVSGAQALQLTDQLAKDSYAIGYAFADGLKRQEVEVREEILIQAIRDVLGGRAPLLSTDEIRTTLVEMRKKLMVLEDSRAKQAAAKSLADGQAFLATHKAQPGVKVLGSGLQYAVVKEGSGPRPTATDTVRVQYRGTLVDGTEFDNSEKRPEPAILRVDGVIKGWAEALQLMNVGSKWHIVVPPDLAYGPRAFGRIPANSTLVFDLELLAIEKKADFKADVQSEAPDLTVTPVK